MKYNTTRLLCSPILAGAGSDNAESFLSFDSETVDFSRVSPPTIQETNWWRQDQAVKKAIKQESFLNRANQVSHPGRFGLNNTRPTSSSLEYAVTADQYLSHRVNPKSDRRNPSSRRCAHSDWAKLAEHALSVPLAVHPTGETSGKSLTSSLSPRCLTASPWPLHVS